MKVSVYSKKWKNYFKMKGAQHSFPNDLNQVSCGTLCTMLEARQGKNCSGFHQTGKKCTLASLSESDQIIPLYEELFDLPKGKIHVYVEDKCKLNSFL